MDADKHKSQEKQSFSLITCKLVIRIKHGNNQNFNKKVVCIELI